MNTQNIGVNTPPNPDLVLDVLGKIYSDRYGVEITFKTKEQNYNNDV